MNKIVIVDYNPSWSELFAQEARHLRNLLGEVVGRVEHIGSTAISGMPAKPIIDLLVAIPSFEQAQQAARPKLEAQGYLCLWRGDRPPGH